MNAYRYKCGDCGLETVLTVAEAARHHEACATGWLPCCEHCGCPPDDRPGHDDACAEGCNDTAPMRHAS